MKKIIDQYKEVAKEATKKDLENIDLGLDLVSDKLNLANTLFLEEGLEAGEEKFEDTFQMFAEEWVALGEAPVLTNTAYTQLAANIFGDTSNDSTLSDPEAEEISSETDSGSGKAPWLIGGGLLLAGLGLAAAGGNSSKDDDTNISNPEAATNNNTKPENTARPNDTDVSANNSKEGSVTPAGTPPAKEPANPTPPGPVAETTPPKDTETPDNTVSSDNGTSQEKPSGTDSSESTPEPEKTNDTTAGNTTDNTNPSTPPATPPADDATATPPKPVTPVTPEKVAETTPSQPPAPPQEPVTPPATTENTADKPAVVPGKESGLTLDIAKHFYSADVIKKYIDTISESGGTFLQLHLSDDANYAFESTVLNQLVENATRNADGTYTNPATGKQFLSTEQIADIVAHAKAKGVEIIPEVDTPNHMDSIFTLLENYKGADYVESIKSDVVDDEIAITNPEAIAMVQSIYSEVIGLMNGSSKHFHIGGDEFGYSASSNHEFITYANTMSAFLEKQGLTTRMWNDGLLKTSLSTLDKNIEVTYWSYDGNPGDESMANERREVRASMKDLTDQGFDVLNYNWYYLYFVPDDNVTDAQSGAHMASNIQAKWDLSVWDGMATENAVPDTGRVIGSSLTIWGEHAETMSDDEIYNYSANGLAALISKTNAGNVDKSKLDKVAVSIDDATQDNHVVSLDAAKSELANVSLSDAISKNYSFVWVNGETDDMVTLSSEWAYSGASAQKGDVSYSLYKTGNHHLYVDTDMAVEIV